MTALAITLIKIFGLNSSRLEDLLQLASSVAIQQDLPGVPDTDGQRRLAVIMAWAPSLELIFATCFEARESPESIKSGNCHQQSSQSYSFTVSFMRSIKTSKS
jgi:hypothetical protein